MEAQLLAGPRHSVAENISELSVYHLQFLIFTAKMLQLYIHQLLRMISTKELRSMQICDEQTVAWAEPHVDDVVKS